MKILRGYLSPQARLTSLLFTAWYSGSCSSNLTSGHWICKNMFFDQYIASMFGKQGNSQQLFEDWKSSEAEFQNCVHTDEIICTRPTLLFLLEFCSPPVPSERFTFSNYLHSTKSFITRKKKSRLKPNKTKKEWEIGGQFLIIGLPTWKPQSFSCSPWKTRLVFFKWSEEI